jgi:preprotein translocase subunit SecF
MNEIEQLKQEIEQIKERNRRVELDKAWETSLARKILVAILTYFVIVIFFVFARLPKPFLNAIVPTVGFVLSTLSVPVFKKMWIGRRKLKDRPKK